LLAVTGITLARESTIGPESGSLTEPTVQDATTTIVEPTATTVGETTGTTDEGLSQRGEPAAGSVTEDSTGPEADELELTGEQATEAEGKNVGGPEGISKPRGVGGKAKDDEGEAKGSGGQEKVTLCHKGKNSITVGAPAQAAHERHGDTVGPCQTEGVVPGPSGATTGPVAAKNGGGNGQPKVTLCHKGKILTVGAPAHAAHLRHGDTEGPCL
jgi:hypothetical protein